MVSEIIFDDKTILLFSYFSRLYLMSIKPIKTRVFHFHSLLKKAMECCGKVVFTSDSKGKTSNNTTL